MSEEIILCIPSEDAPPGAPASFGRPRFGRRSVREHNEDWRQLIPYVMVLNSEGRILGYRRAGGESRLEGKWSVGFGGHVNLDDWHAVRATIRPNEDSALSARVMGVVKQAARRELREELPPFAPGPLKYLGEVRDDSDAVGRVHLGLLFVCRPVVPPDLVKTSWFLPAMAAGLDLESWSRIALERLAGIPKPTH